MTREAALPGLSEWIRVRDYRVQQIEKINQVEIFRESELNSEDVISTGVDHVVIATGASWRKDGLGRSHPFAYGASELQGNILTPDDIMNGQIPRGHIVVYDDDSFYMGGCVAVLNFRVRHNEVCVVGIHRTVVGNLILLQR